MHVLHVVPCRVEGLSYQEQSLFSECNSGCLCSRRDWDPVCGENGITYVSPCLAGCSSSTGSGKYTVGPPPLISCHIQISQYNLLANWAQYFGLIATFYSSHTHFPWGLQINKWHFRCICATFPLKVCHLSFMNFSCLGVCELQLCSTAWHPTSQPDGLSGTVSTQWQLWQSLSLLPGPVSP